MRIFYKVSILLFLILLSCAKEKNKDKKILVETKTLESQMIEVYNQGLEELERGDPIYAARKFNEVERIYPQSIWAPRSLLMSAYSYFTYNYYSDAISELEKFIVKYKNNPRIDYAYYLLALSHFNQIVDEKKDLNEILKSKKYFNFVVKNYPNTDFATDAKFKLDLIEEILASKEMYLARYYLEKEKWIPAINRFKKVVKDYQRTIYVEEALHRLTEIHYRLGLIDESKKYAVLLGYNYQSSEWYEQSYKIFNKTFKIQDTNTKTEDSILKKFKDLFK